MQKRGVTGDTVYVVVHSEERGGMMTEERIDMMMMVVIPNHLLTPRNESSLWIRFPLYD